MTRMQKKKKAQAQTHSNLYQFKQADVEARGRCGANEVKCSA
jgi:hypothetical protein